MQPTEQELQRAQAMFERVFGPDYAAVLMEQLRGDGAEFNTIVMCRIGPEIWGLDALDIKTKVLCTVAIFAALNRSDIKFFIRAALYHGCTRQQIEEVILVAGLESGFPAATAGNRWLIEAIKEHEEFMRSRAGGIRDG